MATPPSHTRPLPRLMAMLLAMVLVTVSSLVAVIADPDPAEAAGGTLLIGETFQAASVSDPRFVPLGGACLTNASRNPSANPPAGSSALKGCTQVNGTPPINTNPSTNGWLQLTDRDLNRSGGTVYNQAIPSRYGVDIQFEQAQYSGTNGADGIGFFLTDGGFTLSQQGGNGGSLGYAQKDYNGVKTKGVAGGFLGLGLDVYGNYPDAVEGRGEGCAPAENPGTTSRTPDTVALRGAGGSLINPATGDRDTNWQKGYCLLNNSPLTGSQTLRSPNTAPNKVQVIVTPVGADRTATVTVKMQFRGTGAWQTLMTQTVKDVPPTYKFGFAASTGNFTDVHLVRLNQLSTVNPIESIALTKVVNPESPSYQADGEYAVGETVPYSFTVTNGELTQLRNVTVNDPYVKNFVCQAASGAAVTNGSITLQPAGQANSSVTCTGSHVLTQAEYDSQQGATGRTFVNTANATGTGSAGSVKSVDASATVNLPNAATSLTLAKSHGAVIDRNNNGKVDAGDQVQYSFTARNTGNVTLSNATVDDPKLSPDKVALGNLAPGATATVQAPALYTISDADVIAGKVVNNATATGTPPTGSGLTPPSAKAQDNVPTVAASGTVTIEKIATPTDSNDNGYIDQGDTIAYTFRVTNTGTVSLGNVKVNDAKLGVTDLGIGQDKLKPGESVDVKAPADYSVTFADMNNGSVKNDATVDASVPDNTTIKVPQGKDDNTVDVQKSNSDVLLTKTPQLDDTNGNGLADVGETVSYAFTVSNEGNVPLDGIVVNDAKLGVTDLAVPGPLAAGATSEPIPAGKTYTITEADVLAGSYVNTAKVTAKAPAGSGIPDPSDESTATVKTAAPASGISLEKKGSLEDKDGDGVADAGETITYSFEVKNTGNVTLRNVEVEDPKIGGPTSVGTLAPGESTTVLATEAYTVTEADVVAGSVLNTATATGNVPADATGVEDPTATDTETIETEKSAAKLSVDKKHADPDDVNGNGSVDSGDEVSYTFTVTNTGNVTLKDVVVDDPKLSLSRLPVGDLKPGESKDVKAPNPYAITDADVIAGKVINEATVTGQPPLGAGLTPPTAKDTDEVPTASGSTSLSIDKVSKVEDVNGNNVTDAGDEISYSFVVTNTGNVTLGDVVVNDEKLGVENLGIGQDTLKPGESVTVNTDEKHTLTFADMQAGNYTNTATVDGAVPGNDDVEVPRAQDEEIVPVQKATSGIELTKTPQLEDTNNNGVADLGETVSYTFTAKNTGNVPLSDVRVDDEKLGVSDLAIPGTLQPGATSAPIDAGETHTITQADVRAGEYVNTATATGKAPEDSGIPNPSDDARATVETAAVTSGLSIEKVSELDDTDGDGRADAGEKISYSFKVTNTGNVSLEGVVVNDAKLGVSDLAVGDLEPGDSKTVDAPEVYSVTEADTIAGSVKNSADATGTVPDGVDAEDPKASDTNEVPTQVASSGLDVVKSHADVEDTNGNGVTDAGDEVSYSFRVTNTGTVTLDDVVVDDAKLSLDDLAVGQLKPGESKTVEAPDAYVITDADVINGSVDNTASVTGKAPEGVEAPKAEDTDTVPTVTAAAALSIEKKATVEDTNDNGVNDADDVVSYEFVVTNTGTIGLTDVVINDAKLGVENLGIGQDTLAPGESVTVDAGKTHTITFADMKAGEYVNTATVDGVVPGNDDIDVAGGEDENTVDVQGSDSEILLNKTATLDDANDNGVADLGEKISYEFTVTNNGNVPLTDVTVNDEGLGVENLTIPGTLRPGQTSDPVSAGETHTITQDDIKAGSYQNSATVTSKAPAGSGIEDPSDDSSATVDTAAPTGTLSLEKTADLDDANDNGVADAGEKISYSFKVTNTGNLTLTDVVINDAKLGLENLAVGDLAPGEDATVPAPEDYTVTEADVLAGKVANAASTTGELPDDVDSIPNPNASDDASVPTADAASGIEVKKSHAQVVDTNGNGVVDAGDEVSYSFEVTNTGNVTLTDVVVDDPKLTLDDLAVGDLAPGASKTVEAPAPYVITDADVINGSVDNTATTSGTPPEGVSPPQSDGTDTVPTVEAAAAVSIEKRSTVEDTNDNGVTDADDVVSYTFVVTNTGTITVNDVKINDAKLGVQDLGIGRDSLKPGESVTVAAGKTHTITFADMKAGEFVNTANVDASVPGRDDIPVTGGEDDNTVDVQGSTSEILLVKKATLDDANGNGAADFGEKVDYEFTVTNNGNVPLTDVVITDQDLGVEDLTVPGTLRPGATSEPLAAGKSHTITEADVLAGSYQNNATVTSKAPAGSGIDDPSDDSSATVDTAAPQGGLSLEKTAELDDANGNGQAEEGEEIAYSFKVTNTGNVTLKDVVVNDAKLGIENLAVGDLKPGESATVDAPENYSVTEGDVLAGKVVNNATTTGKLPEEAAGQPDPEASDTEEVTTSEAASGIDLVKSHSEVEDTNDNGVIDAGDEVTYSFTVTNTGNVTLKDVVVDDAKLGIDNLAVGDLKPGASETVEAPEAYVITDADVIKGSFENTAETTGTAPDGVDAPTAEDTDTVETVTAAAAVSIEKRATVEDTNDNGVNDADDVVSFEFVVTNTGNISVGDVVINDAKLGISNLGIGQDTLKPGESVTVKAGETHTITFADMRAGEYVNTATVDGAVPGNDDIDVAGDEDENTVDVQGSESEILLNKTATLDDANGNGSADLGESISYEFTVTNNGNVPLTDIVVNDEALGVADLSIPGTLRPGQTSDPISAGKTHTITQEDLKAGSYQNTATVTSKAPEGSGIDDPSDDSNATVNTAPLRGGLSLEKVAELADTNDNGAADAGEKISYSFKVTNTGNLTLSDVVVDDAKLGIENLAVGNLEPGESTTVEAPENYTVTEADVLDGKVVNSATGTGELPDDVTGLPNPEAGDDATVPTVTAGTGIEVKKSAELSDGNGNDVADAGEKVAYSFTVTNTGTVTLRDVVINDAKLGIEGLAVGDLKPGESKTVEAPDAYTVTDADVKSGKVRNTADVKGQSPADSGLPQATDDDTVETDTGAVPSPSPTPTDGPSSSPTGPQPSSSPPDDGGNGGGGDNGNGKPGPDLPRTGAELAMALLMGGLLVAAGGALFLLAGRRRNG